MKKSTIIIAVFFIALSAPVYAQTSLSEGIRLYKSGSYDEALVALWAAVEKNPQCPLAYYYAARIRITREQYSRARKNLEAALRDSSGFDDARASLAYTLHKMGNDKEALDNWKIYLNSVAGPDVSKWADVKNIILPENLTDELNSKRKISENEIRKTTEALRDSARKTSGANLAVNDSSAITDSSLVSAREDSLIHAMADTLTGSPITDIEDRIRNSIRTGIYGISGILGILIIGGLIYWFIRKRRRNKADDLNFNDQVARIIDDRDFELGEEQAIKEFEAKKQELARELKDLSGARASSAPEESTFEFSDTANEDDNEDLEDPMRPAWPQDTVRKYQPSPQYAEKSPITEEIKALVSRLYREGHSPEDIARTSDLTKSEVNMILAVREHHMDSLIRDIASGEESKLDRDSLVQAVSDLMDEGADTLEIARRLSISTSEVRLASMMIGKKKQ